MKEPYKTLVGWVLLIGIVWICLKMTDCAGCNKHHTAQSTSITADTVVKLIYTDRWDTIAPAVIKIHDSIDRPLPTVIDTLAVLQSYYRENLYIDTLKDSSLIAIFKIKVAQNKIIDRKLTYKITRPEIERTITVTKTITDTVKTEYSKGFFLAGLRGGVSQSLVATFGPEAVFVTKRKLAVGVGYDLLGKTFNGSLYIQLKR